MPSVKSLPFIVEAESHGLTDVLGFTCGASAADIRNKDDHSRLDTAIIYSEAPCTAAGTFTVNAFAAAPVLLCREALAKAKAFHGIIANSGNANACTGPVGMRDAVAMQKATATALKAPADSIFVCSTGRIGVPLPMPKIKTGITAACKVLAATPSAGLDAARAILTSDSREKVVTVRVPWKDKVISVAGIAKGAGMIEPGMATMFAFIATDAAVAQPLLTKLTRNGVHSSFNAITVDGDMSTNDTVLVLANGASGITVDTKQPALLAAFTAAVEHVCGVLADKIVSDGEKITKVAELLISGARNEKDAESIARAIGNSLLVKSSWFGGDPNWGRILDAAGYAGVALNPDKVHLAYRAADISAKPVPAFSKGKPLPANKPQWKQIVSAARFTILLDLGLGKSAYRLLSSDLTEGYVNYNKSE
ncbi:MAG: bifunctional glutamate N-acetyltransferase/amino-acid acetyltransferase ArgJ [Verrucomicrobiota bacterium]|nr:bifunctional glutamate N-acetyltransferase/amino-acid acetyltransferase ArgJ [Verrucomicrobiota bacterium]